MRPLTVVTAIVLGSAAATTFSLAATAVIYLVLLDKHPQFRAELPTLLRFVAAFVLLTATAGTTLVGQLRDRPWRRPAQVAMWTLLAALATAFVLSRNLM